MRSITRVAVSAPARLHLGFLDLAGDLGRRFGSLGLTLEEVATRVTLTRAVAPSVTGPEAVRARRYVQTMAQRFDLSDRVSLTIERAIPAHAGLGSGTALALAVGAGMARLAGASVDATAVALALGRGHRSGIGIAAFAQGGVLLDGGQAVGGNDEPAGADAGDVPPILARHDFPQAWRVILVSDPDFAGKHGAEEIAAFAKLPPFPPALAAALCRRVLMQALPALIERDIRGFGAAVTALQEAVGDHFAPAQGGRFASPAVAEALGWLRGEGAAGVGQSSWGPTGFALLGDAAGAERLAAAASRRAGAALAFVVARGRNRGAEIVDN
ncbi:MAG: GHMP kinase [Alphaproteobacteria bacterium]|nr:GHMP kinase [Alphaproteobacteria bacterium]